jgi:maltose O-acetyltransferase
LIVGDDVWIGAGDVISPIAPARITIGSHIDFGPGVMIVTGSHEIDLEGEHIGGKGVAASVSIGNGCWLGARATILPGVALAEKTLVAAGAVVTKSVDVPCSLVAGVPAEIKKRLG